MLDASNPEAAKAKKQKTTNRPSTQRFWPQSLANLGQTTTTTQTTAGIAKTTESDSGSRSGKSARVLSSGRERVFESTIK